MVTSGLPNIGTRCHPPRRQKPSFATVQRIDYAAVHAPCIMVQQAICQNCGRVRARVPSISMWILAQLNRIISGARWPEPQV